MSKKHAASSPLDEQLHAHKKHRDRSADSDSSKASVSSQRDMSTNTPMEEGDSSGFATPGDEQNATHNSPASVNSTVTEVPSATNPDTNTANQQGEGEQTEA